MFMAKSTGNPNANNSKYGNVLGLVYWANKQHNSDNATSAFTIQSNMRTTNLIMNCVGIGFLFLRY